MKVRLRHNSIRFRLTQGEVERVRLGESIEEVVAVTPSALTLRLGAGQALGVSFAGGCLSVNAPGEVLGAWAASDEVGISGVAGAVSILIEKDFSCRHPSDPEDNVDTFPNPCP